jgi:hypothetical protein
MHDETADIAEPEPGRLELFELRWMAGRLGARRLAELRAELRRQLVYVGARGWGSSRRLIDVAAGQNQKSCST